MNNAAIILLKLILSHLLTDFILQPKNWVNDRNEKHFSSLKLYLHGLVTAVAVFIITGLQYWLVTSVILLTHIIIDGWKSYQKPTATFFVVDQLLHLLVIIICWYSIFFHFDDIKNLWIQFNDNVAAWKVITAVVFLTAPSGILIGQFTSQWRDRIENAESLANAGKWIGIVERIIVFIFVMNAQFSAIGLLVAAKGIIRFNEKERPEIKTEYLVIGTLMSIAFAVLAGLLVKA